MVYLFGLFPDKNFCNSKRHTHPMFTTALLTTARHGESRKAHRQINGENVVHTQLSTAQP